MNLYLIEHARGPNGAPALVKHCVRLGRRLRSHGIHDYSFPTFVGEHHASVRVGSRVVMLDSNGDHRPCLRPFERARGYMVFDPKALVAHQNRIHAVWLEITAQARRMGWLAAARSDLSTATEYRKYA